MARLEGGEHEGRDAGRDESGQGAVRGVGEDGASSAVGEIGRLIAHTPGVGALQGGGCSDVIHVVRVDLAPLVARGAVGEVLELWGGGGVGKRRRRAGR